MARSYARICGPMRGQGEAAGRAASAQEVFSTGAFSGWAIQASKASAGSGRLISLDEARFRAMLEEL